MELTVGGVNGLTFSVDKATEPKAPFLYTKKEQAIRCALQSVKHFNLITHKMR